MNVFSSVNTEVKIATETTDQLWYKDAIIYQLHVKAFADSNNDGIGDFAGLTEKLGYTTSAIMATSIPISGR
jgi:maltose alpha-D-glucosyltransferase / alpha-amylase